MTSGPQAIPFSSQNADRSSGERSDARWPELLIHLSLRFRLRGAELESATGLAGRELDLIALICAGGPTSVKSLVADLALPRSTMTAIVDRLEERGLVLRHPNPEDRRSIILEATPKAHEAFERYRSGVAQLVTHMKQALPNEELGTLMQSVEKLAKTL